MRARSFVSELVGDSGDIETTVEVSDKKSLGNSSFTQEIMCDVSLSPVLVYDIICMGPQLQFLQIKEDNSNIVSHKI